MRVEEAIDPLTSWNFMEIKKDSLMRAKKESTNKGNADLLLCIFDVDLANQSIEFCKQCTACVMYAKSDGIH